MTPRPLSVVLLALTGFGNTVLDALLVDPRVRVRGVFTHRYDGPFPYYEEQALIDLCAERGVPCVHGATVGSDEGLTRLRAMTPDLILVATFTQILDARVLAVPRLGAVNMHPSLLPRHRGPCPTHATLLAGDEWTGVTAHYVTPKVDEGAILLQRCISTAGVENDGALRRSLASLAGDMVPALLDLWEGDARPVGVPQDASLATYAHRPRPDDTRLDNVTSVDDLRRRLRAFNPWPGTTISVGGERLAVDRLEILEEPPPGGCRVTDSTADTVVEGRPVRLVRRDQQPATATAGETRRES